MEKEIEQGKKSKGKTIVIVLLILIILSLVAYIVYDKGLFETKKENPITKEEKKSTEETLDINGEEVKNLMEKASIVDYSKASYKVSNLSSEKLVYYGITYALNEKTKNVSNDNLSDGDIKGTIREEEVAKEITNHYGSKLKYSFVDKFENSSVIAESVCYDVKHNTKNKEYSYSNYGCDGFPMFGESTYDIKDKVISATKYEDRIEIVTKAVFVLGNFTEKGEDVFYSYNVYKAYGYDKIMEASNKGEEYTNRTNLLKESITFDHASYDDENELLDAIKDTFDKADSYKLVFEKENDNYVFTSMELIK